MNYKKAVRAAAAAAGSTGSLQMVGKIDGEWSFAGADDLRTVNQFDSDSFVLVSERGVLCLYDDRDAKNRKS